MTKCIGYVQVNKVIGNETNNCIIRVHVVNIFIQPFRIGLDKKKIIDRQVDFRNCLIIYKMQS